MSLFPGLFDFLNRLLGKEMAVPKRNPQRGNSGVERICREWLSTLKSQWRQKSSNNERIEKQNINQTTVYKSDYYSQMICVLSFKVFNCDIPHEPSWLGGDKKGKEEGRRKENIFLGTVYHHSLLTVCGYVVILL